MKPSDLIDLVLSMSNGDWVGIPEIDPDWASGLIRSVPSIVIAPMYVISGRYQDPVTTGVAVGFFHSPQTSNRVITAFQRHGIGSRILVPSKIRSPGIVYVDEQVVAVPSMRFSSHAVMAIRQ